MTRPPRKARTVRVEDDLWRAALRRADERGEVLSEEIRAFLKRYVGTALASHPIPGVTPNPDA